MLSLDAKISLMVMVGFSGTESETVKKQALSGKLGAVILFAQNLKNPAQVQKLTASFPGILRAIDQEGGKVQRLNAANGFADYPSASEIGEHRTPKEAKEIYRQMAAELKEAGFNLNLAPTVDLSRDFISPAINGKGRSFGNNPATVISFAREFILAHQEAGIHTCLKHFPGHGSARTDTHLGFTDVTEDWQEDELIPYQALIKEFPHTAVMAAHVCNRRLDSDNPASLSHKIITGLLREQMGFSGVVITDDLQMGAVVNNYPREEAILKAVMAGADILTYGNQLEFCPDLPEQVNETLKNALKQGTLSLSRIDESVRRIEAFLARI